MHMYAVVNKQNQINYDEVLHLLARLIAGRPHLLEMVYVARWFITELVWETWWYYLIGYIGWNRLLYFEVFCCIMLPTTVFSELSVCVYPFLRMSILNGIMHIMTALKLGLTVLIEFSFVGERPLTFSSSILQRKWSKFLF